MNWIFRTKSCQIFDTPQTLALPISTLKLLACPILSVAISSFATESNASQDLFPFKTCFEQSAEKFGLDPSFLAAVASVESSFNPGIVSSSGAIGLMQIKWPQTARELGVTDKSDLFDPCQNIEAGANYLAILMKRFDSKLFALAAYYQGPTRIGRDLNIPSPSVFYIEKVLKEELLIARLNELIRVGSCDLGAFQAISHGIHHPKERLRKTSLWLHENHIFCSIPELIRLQNRLPELMGTADVNGQLKLQINNAILKKTVQKK